MVGTKFDVMAKENELIFKDRENYLTYNENEIKEKLNDLKPTLLKFYLKDAARDNKWFTSIELDLDKENEILEKGITAFEIWSNNELLYNMCFKGDNTDIWKDWLLKIIQKFRSEQKEINEDVKKFLKKYPDIINYTDIKIKEILNKEKFRHSTRSKEKILEIRNQNIENELNGLLTKLFNRLDDDESWEKIAILVQKANDTYNSEILLKIIEAINCKRGEIGFEKFKNIFKVLFELLKIISLVAGAIFLKTLLNTFIGTVVSIIGGIILITLEVNRYNNDEPTINVRLKNCFKNIGFLIGECLIQTYQRSLLKDSVKLIKKQVKKNASLSKENANNINKEIVKENTTVKKEVYLELLKACINLMAENPDIEWALEKKEITVLAEGYTKIKMAVSLDSTTLLQVYPDFMSELCDLETSIKNKIASNIKEDTCNESLEEITTLLSGIESPELTLKLTK